ERVGDLNDANRVAVQVLDRESCFLFWLLFGLPSNWGTSLTRIVAISGILIAIVWSLFFWLGAPIERKTPEGGEPQDPSLRLRFFEPYFDNPVCPGVRASYPWIAIAATLRSFLKIGWGYRYKFTQCGRCIAVGSWIVGLFMLLHLIITLTNTVPILKA